MQVAVSFLALRSIVVESARKKEARYACSTGCVQRGTKRAGTLAVLTSAHKGFNNSRQVSKHGNLKVQLFFQVPSYISHEAVVQFCH